MGVLKKNQNTPRPSEHPPVMGSKVSFMYRCRRNPGKLYKNFCYERSTPSTSNRPSGHEKRSGGIKGYNYITSWYLDGYPDRIALGQQYNIREKPPVVLYNYINSHAGTPESQ